MVNNWETLTLDDVCIKITDGAHQSPKSVENGKPMASVKDLQFYGLDLQTARQISHEDYEELVRQGCKPQVGDVLIAKDGNTALDKVCTFEKDEEVVLLSSVAILRPDPEKITSRFLKYYFLSAQTIDYLKRNFISGAAIPRVILRDFKQAKINLPSLPEQKAIANILGTLDDKIELNRQMNETLEAMAQALFKSWFVDFDPVIDNALLAGKAIPEPLKERAELRQSQLDSGKAKTDSEINDLFPSEFEFTEELGWIPKGWEIQKIKDFGLVVCGKTPSTRKPENYGEDVPFITIPDMHDSVYVIEPSKMLSKSGADSQKNKFLPKGTVCVSCIATPGLVVLVNEPSQTNQQINSIIPHNENYSLFLYESLSRLGDLIRSSGSGGSVFSNLSKSRFEALDLLNPSEESIAKFSSILQPVFDKILANQRNNMNLSNIRDTLLPKLMSGELRIPDAGKLVADI